MKFQNEAEAIYVGCGGFADLLTMSVLRMYVCLVSTRGERNMLSTGLKNIVVLYEEPMTLG